MIHNTGTTAETSSAALAVDGAQPVWMTLNEARERAFTGEIVFETNPEVLTYLDHGVVYYAERVNDASLGRRLLDAGVLDVGQLDRGTVRVGDIEHLGRLFDRDPSVDRDAVVVVAETATEELDRRPGQRSDRFRSGHRISPSSLRRASLVRGTARSGGHAASGQRGCPARLHGRRPTPGSAVRRHGRTDDRMGRPDRRR